MSDIDSSDQFSLVDAEHPPEGSAFTDVDSVFSDEWDLGVGYDEVVAALKTEATLTTNLGSSDDEIDATDEHLLCPDNASRTEEEQKSQEIGGLSRLSSGAEQTDEWELDSIIGRRRRPLAQRRDELDVFEYLCKWHGYEETTWESYATLEELQFDREARAYDAHLKAKCEGNASYQQAAHHDVAEALVPGFLASILVIAAIDKCGIRSYTNVVRRRALTAFLAVWEPLRATHTLALLFHGSTSHEDLAVILRNGLQLSDPSRVVSFSLAEAVRHNAPDSPLLVLLALVGPTKQTKEIDLVRDPRFFLPFLLIRPLNFVTNAVPPRMPLAVMMNAVESAAHRRGPSERPQTIPTQPLTKKRLRRERRYVKELVKLGMVRLRGGSGSK